MAIFKVMDKDGKVLREEHKSYDHYKRHSMRCAAQQKFLDSLWAEGVVEGQIVEGSGAVLFFRFVNRRSEWLPPWAEEEGVRTNDRKG